MAKGKYAKKGSGKGGLALLIIITLLVTGACAAGIFWLLNRKEPVPPPQYLPTESTPAATTEIPTTVPPATQPAEVTTAPTEETTVPTEAQTVPTSPEDSGVAQTALAQVGKPYQSGGSGPDRFDTSGFLFYCLKENGLATKRQKLKELVLKGEEIAREDLQPGDVVFFWSTTEGEVEYAGIYVGDGKFVAARNEQNPVSEMDFESNYFKTRYLTARRFT